jgi:translocator protein
VTRRVSLFRWLVIAALGAALGGLGSANASGFYLGLNRPWWAPPAWLFGPAWSVLYVLMAVAAARVDATPHVLRDSALRWWWVQLAANVAWTWCFFAVPSGALAMADALLLLAAVVMTWRTSARVQPLAGWLLVPYIAWVSYACALTWSVWRRNPEIL